MAKKDKVENNITDENVQASAPTAKENVTFSPEQLAVVNDLIAKSVRSSSREGQNSAISVYGQRDPKSIESVNVKRMFGKFVVGFKNLQNDPMRMDVPKYLRYGVDPFRKLDNQPFITLLLSNDGEEIEEKEVLLTDYYRDRETFQAKVVEIKVNKDIQDHGLLGRSGNMAREVDDKGRLVMHSAVKAESVKETRTYFAELPGFNKPVEFNQDFLA